MNVELMHIFLDPSIDQDLPFTYTWEKESINSQCKDKAHLLAVLNTSFFNTRPKIFVNEQDVYF